MKENLKKGLVMRIIFTLVSFIGFFLVINRYFFRFLPQTNSRVLLDHLVAGFVIPLAFYILFLGIISFFQPKRKIRYDIKWFTIAILISVFIIFYWEIVIQRLKDIDQIIAESIGITLSLAYFLTYRGIK